MPVQPPIQPSLIEPVSKPQAKGFSEKALLEWGTDLFEVIDGVNCSLYEARKINAAIGEEEFLELRSTYCPSDE